MSANGKASAGRVSLSRTFRTGLWLHRWSGLLATPFFLVLCLTGTILIFHEEIDVWTGAEPAVQASTAPIRSLSEVVEAAQALAPGKRVLSVALDEDHPEHVVVSLGEPGQRTLVGAIPMTFDASSLMRLERPAPGSTMTGFLLTLHANWFLGLPGQLAGGVVALLVCICLVSGLIVYGPYVKNLAFGVIRRGRGEPLRQRDLHNLIGVATLGWTLLVAVTGIALALGGLALMAWQATELRRLTTTYASGIDAGPSAGGIAAPPATLDAIRTAAEGVRPGWRATLLIGPGTAFSTDRHYTVLLAGPSGLQKRLFEIALVDARDARVAEVATLPWYLTIVRIAQPLHYGDYGAWPLKLLWCVLAWAALFITSNGAWLWWARKRPGRARKSATVTA